MSILLRQLRLIRSPSLPFVATAFSQRFYASWHDKEISAWNNEEEIQEVRDWIANFEQSDIPNKLCDLTFSHSSGAGGQNVNKLNTKATLRFNLSKAEFLPVCVVRKIREHSRHITNKDEIVIQCDGSRKQSDNAERCKSILFTRLVSPVQKDLTGETPPVQRKRVRYLRKLDKKVTEKIKKKQKEKKEARKFKGGDL